MLQQAGRFVAACMSAGFLTVYLPLKWGGVAIKNFKNPFVVAFLIIPAVLIGWALCWALFVPFVIYSLFDKKR